MAITPIRREIAARVMIYETHWEEFAIRTDYDRLLELYITTVKWRGILAPMEFYCTDCWRCMEKQHRRASMLVLDILWLAHGGNDF